MRFQKSGKNIFVFEDGDWKLKQRCDNPTNATKALSILVRWDKNNINNNDKKV